MNIYKRKRSLQDGPVDVSKMRKALIQLDALKEELDGIEETEKEMSLVMEHVEALERILKAAKLPKISFSTLKDDDIQSLGIIRGKLSFTTKSKKLGNFPYLKNGVEDHAAKLKDQLLEIHDCVSMDYEPGSRMILDAILMTVGRIARRVYPTLEFAIFPQIGASVNPVLLKTEEREVLLTGNIDYTIIQYKDEQENKERLLGSGGCRRELDVLSCSQGRIFLVEAKRAQGAATSPLEGNLPEAVGQAIALAITSKKEEIRFCLSNGQTWFFFVLKKVSDSWIYYQSAPKQIGKEVLSTSSGAESLAIHLMLVLEWLCPSVADLYTLDMY